MKTKFIKILTVSLVIIILPLFLFAVKNAQDIRNKAAPATLASFVPENINVQPKENFLLELYLDAAGNNIAAAKLYISFDASLLEAVSITNGSMFPNILSSGTTTPGNASITVGAASTTQPATGRGVAAILTMKVKDNASGTTQITFAPDTFISGIGEGSTNILIGSTPAKIQIYNSATKGGIVPTDSNKIPEASESAIQNTPTPTKISQSPTNSPTQTLTITPIATQSSITPTVTMMHTPSDIQAEITPSPTQQPIPITGNSTYLSGMIIVGSLLLFLGMYFIVL